jgi:mRNA interferase MazF
VVSAGLRRGDVWWVRQRLDAKQAIDRSTQRRPYVVVSADAWNETPTYPRVTLVPLTGAENVLHRYDTDVFLPRRETGLSKDSVARCVEIYTIFRESLVVRACTLTARRVREMDAALELYLGIVRPS